MAAKKPFLSSYKVGTLLPTSSQWPLLLGRRAGEGETFANNDPSSNSKGERGAGGRRGKFRIEWAHEKFDNLPTEGGTAAAAVPDEARRKKREGGEVFINRGWNGGSRAGATRR